MKYLTEQEERTLLAILKDSMSAARDYMLVSLILNTGLRLNEVRSLTVGDVGESTGIRQVLTVRPETAKRSKSRDIPLNAAIQRHLKQYLTWKAGQGQPVNPESPLFLSRNNGVMDARTVERMTRKWYDRAGFNGYVVHSLRHTFAMKLRRREVGLERIQKLLGHKSLASTGIYVQPSKEDLREAVNLI